MTMSKLRKKNLIKEIVEELDAFDNMLSALVELLEEKGILTQEEWENRIKNKIEGQKDKKSYRVIQLGEK